MNGTTAMRAIGLGARTIVLRWGSVSLRFRLRSALVSALLIVTAAIVSVAALAIGDLPLTVGQVWNALIGSEEGLVRTVVVEWRLPRVLAAAVFGAAMGISGAIFQSITRNPIASPDVIGMSAGSYAGGLLTIIVFGGGFATTAAGSLLGGLATAVAVYALSYRGGLIGFRLIVVGVAVSAMMTALSTYLMLRANREIALSAAVWGAGSLNDTGWSALVPATALIVVASILLIPLAPVMHHLELGDDAARQLGIGVERDRLLLIAIAVVLTALTTAASGPIAFISLAAPQIARRLAATAGTGLVASAAMGALLLSASDLVAQHALPTSLPVGVVTVVLGGGYLIWLLVHETRRRP